MRLARILRKRWQQRRHFASFSGFNIANYSWLLYHVRHLPLPGRNKTCRISLANVSSPFAVRLGSSDLSVVQEIFCDGEYQGVLDAQISDVKTVVDLGSNIGISLRYWRLHFPKGQLIGVEPDASNLEMCRRNLQLAGASDRVKLVRGCVGPANGKAVLDRSRGAWGIRMRAAAEGERAEVPVYDIPTLLEKCGNPPTIDLLKCDIEGAERELFGQCRPWIGKIRNMVIELHWPYMKESLLKDLNAAGAEFDVHPLHMTEQLQVLLLTNRKTSASTALAAAGETSASDGR